MGRISDFAATQYRDAYIPPHPRRTRAPAPGPDRTLTEVINDLISHFTYKPGWEIKALVDDWGGVIMSTVRTEPDANDPTQQAQVALARVFDPPPSITPEVVKTWVHALLVDAELHEVDEWLRLDGHRITNPHPARMQG